ncbi:MAG: TetM/TetW/TetO/TetS family tetracycline resistance ribosomal protection protein [Clostridia bacterium]|nr:TetM/TetW/TetO/TetS family tetracycline resistance ribosomal protection protein [Clostridia bacterium]
MKKLVIGILAHVDAGKTTLSESMLFLSGKIRKLGRVDNKDAYLDTFELEKVRGITIFSKQAILEVDGTEITLLDTPGHVDFSAEMERTLQVLDYAVLVISGTDGVQGHTKTLWRLFEIYKIPVFLFINKMDQKGADRENVKSNLRNQLGGSCVDFSDQGSEGFCEQLAMCDEPMFESFLENGKIDSELIRKAIRNRKVFPCFYGSALKLEGVEEFMKGFAEYSIAPTYPKMFGAKIFKITRDEQGNRLTHMKITGGHLKVKDAIISGDTEEKINQIRVYSGQKYEAPSEVEAGTVCAVTGPIKTRPGEGLGIEEISNAPILEPVLTYQVVLPEGCDPRMIFPGLRQIEEEEPELHFVWKEALQEIHARIMGEVQIEILQSMIQSRFDVEVTFGEGRIVYKETIANVVEGVGHFEPLRHYAEVHLLLEPGEPGSGLVITSNCSEDDLGKSWQRLVISHLKEKPHKGVLTGSEITDLNITLVSGKAHNKHTEGGDFREATFRALRQGLKEAESILLEPYYDFRLELPEKMVGRAMTDIEKMHGLSEISQIEGENAILTGSAPVSTMRNYQRDVIAYTKGLGRLLTTLKGYGPCHDAMEVIKEIGYDSESDLENPTGSVFCKNGTGYLVEWNQVKENMHLEPYLKKKVQMSELNEGSENAPSNSGSISLEEIDQIFNTTFFANQGKKTVWRKQKSASDSFFGSTTYVGKRKDNLEEYLLVDGYNIIFSWPELKTLADSNMDGARAKLMDMLSNYQGIRKCEIIVVFDAYRVAGRREEFADYHNIHLVFTSEAQTADHYIEKFAHQNQDKYKIIVATSDGMQQMIIRGAGAELLSSRELREEIDSANERIKEEYQRQNESKKSAFEDALTSDEKGRMDDMINKSKS